MQKHACETSNGYPGASEYLLIIDNCLNSFLALMQNTLQMCIV